MEPEMFNKRGYRDTLALVRRLHAGQVDALAASGAVVISLSCRASALMTGHHSCRATPARLGSLHPDAMAKPALGSSLALPADQVEPIVAIEDMIATRLTEAGSAPTPAPKPPRPVPAPRRLKAPCRSVRL
jgi:hypothetical protein